MIIQAVEGCACICVGVRAWGHQRGVGGVVTQTGRERETRSLFLGVIFDLALFVSAAVW